MNAAEIRAAFDRVFDHALVFHGYADHMRDYDVFVSVTGDPGTGRPTEHLRYRFTHCVRATVTTALAADLWRHPDDYVWDVRWQELYPGLKLVPDSAEARRWASTAGRPFHEATIEANAHHITLVFADLVVEPVSPRQNPFV